MHLIPRFRGRRKSSDNERACPVGFLFSFYRVTFLFNQQKSLSKNIENCGSGYGKRDRFEVSELAI
jgi:hypothetical protein